MEITNKKEQCKLIADVTLLYRDKVLLIKYIETSKYDRQKGWLLPNDLIEHEEHPEDAAKRIVQKQLGLSGLKINLSHIESFVGNDRSWHMVFHFKAEMGIQLPIESSKEVKSYEWFAFENFPENAEVAHRGWSLFTVRDIITRELVA